MDTHLPADPLLAPPVDLPGFQLNNWFDLPADHPVSLYIQENLWDRSQPPQAWEAARLSKAAYLFREKVSRHTVLVKFYSAKVRSAASAERYARNEFERTQLAGSLLVGDADVRALSALACYKDVLFLEYIDGLTLEDAIAIRRNRPGMLLPVLEKTARLLARLHSQGRQPGSKPAFHYEVKDVSKFVAELAKSGVLEGNPLVTEALRHLIEGWGADPSMSDYLPTYIHGDATTSNFVIPWGGGLVAIDWERMWIADPASELGRLSAELAHGILQFGGSYTEAAELIHFTEQAYLAGLPSDWEAEALLKRARFYQASSTLRISRNGWLPRLERTRLVAQALALLA